jgi:hypothetical protein
MGRPATRPTKLRDGYYIEIRNKNQNTGIKIHRPSKELLIHAIKEYEQTKKVIVLGKLKNGKMEKIDIPELN